MGSTISTTTIRDHSARRPIRGGSRRRAGFTLVEIMVGSVLGSIVLAGVLSAFVMLGRSGALIYNYNGMSIEGRRALEEFSQDVRMASAIVTNSTASVTLTVPENYTGTSNKVTYFYDSATGTFRRRPGTTSVVDATATLLVRSVVSGEFVRYNRLDIGTESDAETKRLVFMLRMRTGGTGFTAATENAISASFLLRNKPAN